jgi:hypothetical protein
MAFVFLSEMLFLTLSKSLFCEYYKNIELFIKISGKGVEACCTIFEADFYATCTLDF